MSRLTLDICPEMTAEILEKLKKAGINTVYGFVSEDLQNLSIKTDLNLQLLSIIRKNVLVANSSMIWRGDYLYDKILATMQVLSTGCSNLDMVLGGGLVTTEITELYGLPAVGKTQSCLSIASQVAIEHEQRTIYIDTSGSFSSKRLAEIMQKKYENIKEKMDMAAHMTRVKCVKAFDVYTVLTTLEDIKNKFCTPDAFYEDVILIIVDSVASVITPILGGLQNQGHGLMVSLGRILKYLATEHNLAIVVTNNVVSDFTTKSYTKPALGNTWSHLPNNRIHMFFNHNKTGKERLLQLTKSSRMCSQPHCGCMIGEDGLS